MRLLLWFTLFVIFAQVAQAGIYRKYVRRPRLPRYAPHPRGLMFHHRRALSAPSTRRVRSHHSSPWASFFQRRHTTKTNRVPVGWPFTSTARLVRNPRRFRFFERRDRVLPRYQQHHRVPMNYHHYYRVLSIFLLFS